MTDGPQPFLAESGSLYVISTPIGNLQDITPRAISLLESCDLVACEDTRVTGKLLQYLGFSKPMQSYRDENEKAQAAQLVEQIQSGKAVALVCDAGTPTLSDPGFRLVRACRVAGVPVIPVPGPTALMSALAASGLPTNGFLYVGFLPPKKSARVRFFEKHLTFPYTIALYESCHRIQKFVDDALTILGKQRTVCVARELTKKHETFLVGPLETVAPQIVGKNLKGEFVILIAPEDFTL